MQCSFFSFLLEERGREKRGMSRREEREREEMPMPREEAPHEDTPRCRCRVKKRLMKRHRDDIAA